MARTKNKEWLLIVDRVPLNGSWNMAVDDYLFHSLPESPRTYVRFYRWQRPTVSLGYSQNVRRVVDLKYCKEQGIDIVRRMTGGKLVLHHNEVTYSICSSDGEAFTSKLIDSYRLISESLMRGLRRMGLMPCLADAPPDSYLRGNLPCFSYPARNEVEVNGKKIIGSAQKRAGSRFIQHGSIPLEQDEGFLNSVSFPRGDKSLSRMTSLSRALGKAVSFDWAVGHFISGISEFFGVKLRPKIFDDAEKRAISSIEKERYANRDWTYNLKSGDI